jgi:hypothetical protein
MITHRISTIGFGAAEPTPDKVRVAIRAMEQGILASGEFVELPVEHEFAFGIYFRKIKIPKNVCLTGRVHRQDDLLICLSGDISILTERGLVRLQGPASITGKAGVKPFAVAHEDTLFATAHHTHLTDLTEIEKQLFEDEPHGFDFITGKVLQEVLPCPPQP